MQFLTNFPSAAIIGFLFAFGLAIVSGAGALFTSDANSSAQGQDLITIAQGYRKVYKQTGYPASLNAAQLTQSDPPRAPSDIVKGGAIVSRTLNQPITGAASGSTFTLSVVVPQDECITLMQGGTMSGTFSSVAVSGAATRQLPLTNPDNALSDCATTTNTMVFTARP